MTIDTTVIPSGNKMDAQNIQRHRDARHRDAPSRDVGEAPLYKFPFTENSTQMPKIDVHA